MLHPASLKNGGLLWVIPHLFTHLFRIFVTQGFCIAPALCVLMYSLH